MRTEKITILNIEYKIKLGFGTLMLFEEETGKNITDIKIKSDVMKLAWCALKYNNKHFDYSYEFFIDEILDNNIELFIHITKVITDLLFSKEVTEEKK